MDPNPNASISASNAPYRDLPVASSSLFSAKAKKGLTFEQIGKAIDKDEVWVAALFYGQAKATDDELRSLSKVLGIGEESLIADLGSHWYPNRGIGPIPPTDPVIYRLFEGVLVYGHALKFGDGIMSMIDCKVHVEKKPDPKGDRVLLTFDGKFLPYAKW
ncbi:cyanate lyase C-terminal domain-containing protein [Lactarius pseudohatsudake]|nr:cyanate lyase C-terminal domain-containing protein [Lactarius pseudohatsudake]